MLLTCFVAFCLPLALAGEWRRTTLLLNCLLFVHAWIIDSLALLYPGPTYTYDVERQQEARGDPNQN